MCDFKDLVEPNTLSEADVVNFEISYSHRGLDVDFIVKKNIEKRTTCCLAALVCWWNMLL